MTTLPDNIEYTLSGNVHIKKLGDALSSRIRGVQARGYTGPNVGISYGSHVAGGCWAAGACDRVPAPTVSNVRFFRFSPPPRASWHVRIRPRDHGACTITKNVMCM